MGVEALPPGRKKASLDRWFEELAGSIECLAWDVTVARRWARLVVDQKRRGKAVPLLDSMIAATALTHGLTIATRNVSDFRKTGASVVDPFTA
jgi:hypothetical protein